MGVARGWCCARSSKPLRGAAEAALVGSTPIHPRSTDSFQTEVAQAFCLSAHFPQVHNQLEPDGLFGSIHLTYKVRHFDKTAMSCYNSSHIPPYGM